MYLLYAIPLSVIIFDLGDTEGQSEWLYWVCLFIQILFQIPEYLNIHNDGFSNYISDVLNVFDQIGFISFLVFLQLVNSIYPRIGASWFGDHGRILSY